MTISIHARQRAFQRYGVLFSRGQWSDFERSVTNRKRMIPLGSGRLVCFFAGTWFLLGCGANGTVRTFLPREDIFENEKQLLRTNVLYRRINIDSFHVWSRPMEKSNPQTPPVPLPSDVELSPDVIAAANKLLDRATM